MQLSCKRFLALESSTTKRSVHDGPVLTVPRQLAADCCVSRFRDWDNPHRVFARMTIASSHGARELKLPSGEDHRLRFVPRACRVATDQRELARVHR